MNLKGINGTDEEPALSIDGDGGNKNANRDGKIVTNGGTFNMHTGVSLQNNKIENACGFGGCAVRCVNCSTFNMWGGSINQNKMKATNGYGCYGIICLTPGSMFNMSGGIISNNTSSTSDYGIIYCGEKSYLNISGGEISKNNGGIYCESTSVVNMTNGSITENSYGIKSSGTFEMYGGNISKNSGTGVTSSGKFTMSGGSIGNNKKGLEINGEFVLSKDSQIVSNEICLAKDKKIIIDGFISGNNGSFMFISLTGYNLSDTKKVIYVINGAKLDDVLEKFRLSDKRYRINSEGRVVDVRYQNFQKTDDNTGIIVSSGENVLGKDIKVNITKVDSIDNVKDTTFYIESLCDNVKSLYSVKFTSNGKQYVPEETGKITFYIPIKEFDTGKIPEVKLYDSNKKTISEGGEVKAIKGMLYIKIPTTEGNLQ